MATLSMAMPVLPGKAEQLRSFCRQVVGHRLSEFEASEKRIGLTRETWTLQPSPGGDLAIIWVEGADPGSSLGLFVQSQQGFDSWFKEQLKDITGVDLNQPPAGSPEVLFDWGEPVGARS
jgi:hypothetical protein